MNIFTDGSYTTHKGIGGWGLVAVKGNEIVATKYGTEVNSTSNRMELLAIIEAIRLYKENINIYTDSLYAVNGYHLYSKQWKKYGWKKRNNREVKNADLWKIIDSLRNENINIEWVKGHSGNQYNELADSLAKSY